MVQAVLVWSQTFVTLFQNNLCCLCCLVPWCVGTYSPVYKSIAFRGCKHNINYDYVSSESQVSHCYPLGYLTVLLYANH